MKKGEIYNVTATKESVNGKECNKLEFESITSNIGYIGRYPNWKSVIPKVSNELALHFDKNAWNKDNTEMVGFVGNEPISVRQENDNKLLVRFLGDAWCPDVVEEWVKRIEHDKNNDVDYVIDTYMFGVIENDRERKSSDFHVSFYYRG